MLYIFLDLVYIFQVFKSYIQEMTFLPIINIDSKEYHKLDISIALQKLYYQPSGYQKIIKKLFEASQNIGFDFILKEVKEWLEKQLIYLIHKARPKYIPCVNFNTIIISMEVIQADILYMPYDKIGKITYIFCLTYIDVGSQYKWALPIDTTLDILNIDDPSLEGILTFAIVAEAFEKIFNDSKCLLTWPKLLLTDKGFEFKGDCERLMKEHNIKI